MSFAILRRILALAFLPLAAATAARAADRIGVEVRLFRGVADGESAAGNELGPQQPDVDARKWTTRPLDDATWERRVDALVHEKRVEEIPLAGDEAIVVTRERPWQVERS